jgi:hypothetical protein
MKGEVMIAQVFTTSAGAGGSAPTPEYAQEIAEKQRAVDGCEGIVMLADPASGEGVAFTLWRDEVAMKAAAAQQEEDIAAAKKVSSSVQVSAPKVYEVLARA